MDIQLFTQFQIWVKLHSPTGDWLTPAELPISVEKQENCQKSERWDPLSVTLMTDKNIFIEIPLITHMWRTLVRRQRKKVCQFVFRSRVQACARCRKYGSHVVYNQNEKKKSKEMNNCIDLEVSSSGSPLESPSTEYRSSHERFGFIMQTKKCKRFEMLQEDRVVEWEHLTLFITSFLWNWKFSLRLEKAQISTAKKLIKRWIPNFPFKLIDDKKNKRPRSLFSGLFLWFRS